MIRNLIPSDRVTCIIASRTNFFFFITNFSLAGRFDVFVLSISSYIYKLTSWSNVINPPVSKKKIIASSKYRMADILLLLLLAFHPCFIFISLKAFKTLWVYYSSQSTRKQPRPSTLVQCICLSLPSNFFSLLTALFTQQWPGREIMEFKYVRWPPLFFSASTLNVTCNKLWCLEYTHARSEFCSWASN